MLGPFYLKSRDQDLPSAKVNKEKHRLNLSVGDRDQFDIKDKIAAR